MTTDEATNLSFADFAERCGARFTMNVMGGTDELVLEAAEPLPRSARPGGSFRLAFRGSREPVYPQAIYRLSTHGLAIEIFLVPIACDQTGTVYEAIFN